MSVSSRWSEIGALSAAGTVAATILCCVPFATGLLGAALAAFGARVAPFQPYLTAASLGLLGYAFYQAYRRDPACPGAPGLWPGSSRAAELTASPARDNGKFSLGDQGAQMNNADREPVTNS